MPHLFNTNTNLTKELKKVAGVTENQIIGRIKKLLKPFILRRLKSELRSFNLPPKVNKIVTCEMTPTQSEMYNIILKQSKKLWNELKKNETVKGEYSTVTL